MLYDGIIKDGIENWNEANQADHKLEEISGKEALAILENEYIKENKSQREIIEWQSRKITDLEIAIDDVEGEKNETNNNVFINSIIFIRSRTTDKHNCICLCNKRIK